MDPVSAVPSRDRVGPVTYDPHAGMGSPHRMKDKIHRTVQTHRSASVPDLKIRKGVRVGRAQVWKGDGDAVASLAREGHRADDT